MSNTRSFWDRFRYWFDNQMAKGTRAMIVILAIASFGFIALAAAFITFTGLNQAGAQGGLSFGEAFWEGLMRTLDSGTMGSDTGTGFRLVMFFVTVVGIFVVSTLIGIISNGVEDLLNTLRKGRSRALESGHTVILGWSPQVFTIISEIVKANENHKGSIVILSEEDKANMDDAIKERIGTPKNTRIITRSGSPIDPNDIEIASPHTAKSIIILPPEQGDADSYVIKTALAFTNNPNRRAEPYRIVTQMRDRKNMEVIRMVGAKDNLHTIPTGEVIARVTAQTSRQSGLSAVYTEMLNFDGDEIYFKEEPKLVGKSYAEALFAYEESAVMGLRFADGHVQLNPPMAARISPADKIIALSADDDTIKLSGMTSHPINGAAIIKDAAPMMPKAEKGLILGWNETGATIVRELDNYVAPGSEQTIVSEHDIEDIRESCAGVERLKLNLSMGDITDRRTLDRLGVADFDHVIVLADSDLDVHEADARTLITLLHLRDMAEKDSTPFSIVSEMLDMRNRELAEVTRVDDFIVSDHLISLMTSQISENGELDAVFKDLFDPEGSEVYLKSVGQYVDTSKPVTFYTLLESARQRGETAIGYRLESEADEAGKNYGVHTNPKKSVAVSFAPDDKIIVLAEN
jgi:voltage-gated potassium channel Kch